MRALAAGCLLAALPFWCLPTHAGQPESWPSYGNDVGGSRYSPLADIGPENVASLEEAWTYRTGDVSDGRGEVASTSAFELTPILVDGTLYLCTPFNRVIALDPETGAERWAYDPEIDLSKHYSNQLICRGLSTWLDPKRASGEVCQRRIFTGTNDARLIALDARTGLPCPDFGKAGQVDLKPDVGMLRHPGEYQVTSPPAVVHDLVVVGSAISDNQRVDAPSGVVRAFDARSGALRWAWDPFSASQDDPRDLPRSQAGYHLGTANVWSALAVDEERDLLFAPTGNTAPDYYGGHRRQTDAYASAVVALRASTGEVVWSFQTVHHDLWDFDVPAQPTLFTLRRDGREIPALVQATKMGMLFVLNRETGEPLFPVEERPVPQRAAPGETPAPTQPFPTRPPPLVPQSLSPEEAWGVTPWDRAACRKRLEALHWEGMYTPPSRQGTLMFPGNAGGSNWGGVAVDPERQIVVANTMSTAWAVTLIPSADFERERAANPGVEIAPQTGTPFAMRRELLLSPLGVPCNPPPWGSLAAVDIARGEIRWQVPLGTIRDIAPIPIPYEIGVPNIGGPLVTRSGLIFIAATMDDYLRAYDIQSGQELWKGRLPAGGQATPMSYRATKGGRQFVVIAAGGHARAGTKLGDSLVAYALPK